ncbi:subtype B tannase [Konateibacter massiliensis]|uniref:subtype B tannase n=1 Tax=Konateibacter massiliensis TaxID=2002841 RepID=UPI000C1616EE|nr:subtype B tannase [Konateibacter massiliensis]
MAYKLEFDNEKYTVETVILDDKELTYRAFENIVYVKNPVDIKYHSLSIFVPEAYYEEKTFGAWDLHTAPIFFPNTVGGYMPGPVERPGKNFMGDTNATFYALLRGFVVVSAGVRGRGLKNKEGKFIGTAPACVVDQKAAIRYLRYNKGKVPGDVERIITNGTSAGGALSSLLGATGNHADYEPYLKELGAAKERDDVFASSCYCPITNLDHADMAYEWEFCGLNNYHRIKFGPPAKGEVRPTMTPVDGEMTSLQQELSKEAKALFPAYLNGLKLRDADGAVMEADEDGDGSFKEFVTKQIMASAQRVLDLGKDLRNMQSPSHKATAGSLDFLTVEAGKVTAVDFEKYVLFRTRMKETLAFDNISMGTPENELFGTADTEFRHFTEFSKRHSAVNGELADEKQVKMMNPMNYIEDNKADTAKHYRIRHGAVDRDTSLAISAILTLFLRNNGVEVDYHLPWGVLHAGDYDLDELFEWMDAICSSI